MKEYRDERQDKDWERISGLLKETDCVPEAPDCRAAVMARIARPRPVRRFVWAYGTGFAALLVAAILITPFLRDSGQKDIAAYSPEVKQSTSAPQAEPKTALYSPVPKATSQPQRPHSARRIAKSKPVMMAKADGPAPEALSFEKGVVRADAPELHWHDASDHHAAVSESDKLDEPDDEAKAELSAGYAHTPSRAADAAIAKRVRGSAPAAPAAAATIGDTTARTELGLGMAAAAPTESTTFYSLGRLSDASTLGGNYSVGMPIAVAMVTWPSNNQPIDSYDYAYTDRNTATGTTTECRVKRSGNSVEIHIESRPAVTDPPVRGSLEHETMPNV